MNPVRPAGEWDLRARQGLALILVVGIGQGLVGFPPVDLFKILLLSPPGSNPPFLTPEFAIPVGILLLILLLRTRATARWGLIGSLAILIASSLAFQLGGDLLVLSIGKLLRTIGQALLLASLLTVAVETLPRRWWILAPFLLMISNLIGYHLAPLVTLLVPVSGRLRFGIYLFLAQIAASFFLIGSKEQGETRRPTDSIGALVRLSALIALLGLGQVLHSIVQISEAPNLPTSKSFLLPAISLTSIYILPIAILGGLLFSDLKSDAPGFGRSIRVVTLMGVLALLADWFLPSIHGAGSVLGGRSLTLLLSIVTMRIAASTPSVTRLGLALVPGLVFLTMESLVTRGFLSFGRSLHLLPLERPILGTVLFVVIVIGIGALLFLPSQRESTQPISSPREDLRSL